MFLKNGDTIPEDKILLKNDNFTDINDSLMSYNMSIDF